MHDSRCLQTSTRIPERYGATADGGNSIYCELSSAVEARGDSRLVTAVFLIAVIVTDLSPGDPDNSAHLDKRINNMSSDSWFDLHSPKALFLFGKQHGHVLFLRYNDTWTTRRNV